MKFGLPISVTFHVLAAFGGLLMWSTKVKPFADLNIIPLELVVVTDVTDIKANRPKPDRPEPETVNEPEPAEQEPTEPEIASVPKPTEEPKPDQEQPAEPATPAFDLDALAEAFEDVRTDNPDAETQQVLGNENQMAEIAENARQSVGAGVDNTANALDYIRSRLRNCWIVDEGAIDYQNLVIEVSLLLKMDGSIHNITVLNNAEIIASSNRAWTVARHNATTALRKCAPYDGLLTIDYDVWKDLRLHLDPGEN